MSTAENKPSRSFSFWRVLLFGAVLGGICVGIFKWAESGIRERSEKESERSAAHWFRLTTPTLRTLDPRFTDANNDLVADPPADSSRRSPDKLIFSFVAGPEAERQIADFKDFTKHLSELTGKPVETAVYPSTEKQQERSKRASCTLQHLIRVPCPRPSLRPASFRCARSAATTVRSASR